MKKKSIYLTILTLFIISFTCQKIYANTQIDQKKAYQVCLKYHGPRLQNLCSRINTETFTFEDILDFHHGKSAEVVNDTKNTWTKNNLNNNDTKVIDSNKNESSNNNNWVKPKKIVENDKEIINKSYKNFFWQIINIVVITFLCITYIVNRVRYFKRRRKMKMKKKKL